MSAPLETKGDDAEADDTKANNNESVAHLTTLIHETKVDGGKKSVWQMSLETLGMADGNDKKDDILADTFESAMEGIQICFRKFRTSIPSGNSHSHRWNN
jgi:hypothetical protein